jgi:Rrf2 family protein
MLALTKKTDYALIALALLARQSDGVVSAREIARESGLPLPILTNVLKTLAGSRIVISARGATGGYALARPISAISLYELVTSIEGPFHLVQCASREISTDKGGCEHESSCPIRRPVYRIHDRLEEFLKSVSLDEITQETPATQRAHDAETVTVGSPQIPMTESAG